MVLFGGCGRGVRVGVGCGEVVAVVSVGVSVLCWVVVVAGGVAVTFVCVVDVGGGCDGTGSVCAWS